MPARCQQMANIQSRVGRQANRGGRGLSLIELLVSITIGVVLAFAAVNLFLQSKLAYLQDQELARLQENGRYALRYLSHELSMAGFLATEVPGRRVSASESGSQCFDHLMNTATSVEHLDDVSANGTPAGAGPGLPLDCLVAGKLQAGSDLVLVRRTADTPSIFQGEPRGATDPNNIYLRIPMDTGVPGLQRGVGTVPGASLWEYVPQVLFLRRYSVVPGDGVPALCRKRLGRSSNGMAPTECLVEGVENMQIEFGIDETGDRRPDRFDPQPAPDEMAAAVAARIYLLLRSVHPVVGHLDSRFYQLGSHRISAANDSHFRRVMQTTVLLRNTGVFR
jgi:type IV pilus assembly protein PilW